MNAYFIDKLQQTVDEHGIDLDVALLVAAYAKHKTSTGFGDKTKKTQKFGPFELYVSAAPFSGEMILSTILSDVEEAVSAAFRQTMIAAGKDLYDLAPGVFEDESAALSFVSTLLSAGFSEEALSDEDALKSYDKLLALNIAGWMRFKEQLETRTSQSRKKLALVGRATKAVVEFFVVARHVGDTEIEPEDFMLLDEGTMDRIRQFVHTELGKRKAATARSK
jgi:hypothetical protein